MDKTVTAELLHVRTAALKILVDSDHAKSTSLLLAAANDPNKKYRAAALRFAIPYLTPANTALWVKKLGQSDDAVKADILIMFRESATAEALPATLKYLKSKNSAVQLAAIEASARIGQSKVLDELLQVMSKGDSPSLPRFDRNQKDERRRESLRRWHRLSQKQIQQFRWL